MRSNKIKSMWRVLQAISQTDSVSVVDRAGGHNEGPDLGAYGIIVPLVNTACGRQSPSAPYTTAAPTMWPTAMTGILVMATIDTKEGLANLDVICATPGLDAVYIGPADLSFALGLAPRGDSADPLDLATCDKILGTAHKHGIKCVMHCASAAFAAGQ